MTNLKRDAIKYVRDKAKRGYEKGTECVICGSADRLDFHHFWGLTELFDKWCRTKKIKILSEADVLAVRDQFIAEHQSELYEEAVTLCHKHHEQLHSVYGFKPKLSTAPKQKRWVQRQIEKNALN